ncbi:MAG: YaeQ family protein [Caldimonas sp.]
MAQKATVCKAALQIADIDRGLYADHQLTLARHPSETDERMMIRLLAFALCVPADSRDGGLEFAKGMWDPDEPELWQKDLTGRIVQWIEVGQPEERRLAKASGRSDRVSVFAFGSSAGAWWSGLGSRIHRAGNIEAWRIPAEQSRELAELAARGMKVQLNRQDGMVWVADGTRSVQVVPERMGGA